MKVKDVLNVQLKDDRTEFGGASFAGETVKDFVEEIGIDLEMSVDALNDILEECGIRRIGTSLDRLLEMIDKVDTYKKDIQIAFEMKVEELRKYQTYTMERSRTIKELFPNKIMLIVTKALNATKAGILKVETNEGSCWFSYDQVCGSKLVVEPDSYRRKHRVNVFDFSNKSIPEWWANENYREYLINEYKRLKNYNLAFDFIENHIETIYTEIEKLINAYYEKISVNDNKLLAQLDFKSNKPKKKVVKIIVKIEEDDDYECYK